MLPKGNPRKKNSEENSEEEFEKMQNSRCSKHFTESLILAQNERWRRA